MFKIENASSEQTFTIENAIQHLDKLARPPSEVAMLEADKEENEKSFNCSKCQEVFTESSTLLKHNRTVHIQAKINSLLLKLGMEAPEEN